MPNYIYEATTPAGGIVKAEITASNKKEVMNYLSAKGFTPIFIELKKKEKAILRPIRGPLFAKITTLDKAEFATRLSALLKAGISLTRALEILVSGTEKPEMKKFLLELKSGIEKGQSFHLILKEHKKDFSPFFIGLIKAGEESGNLDRILDELAVSLRKHYALVKKIQSAAFYPTILLIAAILIMSFLIIYVIPRLVTSYAQADVELPAITVAIIQISSFLRENVLGILLAVIFLIIILRFFKKTPKGELFFAKISIRLPLIGGLFQKMALTRFCRTLSMLIRSGSTFGESLEITADAIGNTAYKNIILGSKEMVVKGILLSNYLKDYPNYFPALLTGTISVGEEAGKLDEMLTTIGDFYEEEVDRKADTLTTAVEPVLLLIMGVIVAFIALSVILPIYQFISAF